MSRPGPLTGGLQVIAVVGATATGKSALAIELAEQLAGEVVNLDAYLVYRGMDIGTAKPAPAELARVRHHLIDIFDIDHDASVAEFQELARQAIAEINARDRVAVCVGGSGLYVRAVLDDLEIPGTDRELRAKYEARLAELGPAGLHAELADRDPAAAAAILPGNSRRVVRALEVIELTGRPFTAVLGVAPPVYRDLRIGLEIPRQAMSAQVGRRVAAMFAAGWSGEVAELADRGLFESRTASKALGYREVAEVVAGRLAVAAAGEAITAATLKFAKRQLQWFRRDARVQWLPWDAPDLLSQALRLVSAAKN